MSSAYGTFLGDSPENNSVCPEKNSLCWSVCVKLSLVFILLSVVIGICTWKLASQVDDPDSDSSFIPLIMYPGAMDDKQVIQCVDSKYNTFGTILQHFGGFEVELLPIGGILFLDRGSFGAYKEDPDYSYTESYENMIERYDAALDDCLDKGKCDYNFTTEINLEDTFEFGQISCAETCVGERLLTYDDHIIDFDVATCIDPVEFAFLYAVPLVKSCFSPSYDCKMGGSVVCENGCYDCLSACVESGEESTRML
jgi:hypothetical protein